MKRNQAYVLLVGLLIVVLFLAGLYSSTSRNVETNSISLDDSLEVDDSTKANSTKLPLTPIVITTTTPVEVANGNLMPTSVNTLEVLSVQNFEDHLRMKLGYVSQDLSSKSISVNVFNSVNYFDSVGERVHVDPDNLYQYISVGDRLSIDFFSNSISNPSNEDQVTAFFAESGLNAPSSSSGLVPVDTEKLQSLMEMGGLEIDQSEFRIITIRKVPQ